MRMKSILCDVISKVVVGMQLFWKTDTISKPKLTHVLQLVPCMSRVADQHCMNTQDRISGGK